MSARDGGYAYPVGALQGSVAGNGMTLRDHFAGLAMQAVLSDENFIGSPEQAATYAYSVADAMLKERVW